LWDPFGSEGEVLPGCDLRVLKENKRPMQPGLANAFDHSAVYMSVALQKSKDKGKGRKNDGTDGKGAVQGRAVWHAGMRSDYLQCLASPQILERLGDVGKAVNVASACREFEDAIWDAMNMLQGLGHRVFRQAVGPPAHRPQANKWWNQECGQKKRELREAEKGWGREHAQFKDAVREFRKVVKKAERKAAEKDMEATVERWYNEPRKFWGRYTQRPARGSLNGDVQGWTVYFRELCRSNGCGEYSGGSLDTHIAQHACCFQQGTGHQRSQPATGSGSSNLTGLSQSAGGTDRAPGLYCFDQRRGHFIEQQL
jgi:hypothetical protein